MGTVENRKEYLQTSGEFFFFSSIFVLYKNTNMGLSAWQWLRLQKFCRKSLKDWKFHDIIIPFRYCFWICNIILLYICYISSNFDDHWTLWQYMCTFLCYLRNVWFLWIGSTIKPDLGQFTLNKPRSGLWKV